MREKVAEKGEPRAIYEMRKYISGFLKGVPMVSGLRARLMEETTGAGVEDRLGEYVAFLQGGPWPWPQAALPGDAEVPESDPTACPVSA